MQEVKCYIFAQCAVKMNIFARCSKILPMMCICIKKLRKNKNKKILEVIGLEILLKFLIFESLIYIYGKTLFLKRHLLTQSSLVNHSDQGYVKNSNLN